MLIANYLLITIIGIINYLINNSIYFFNLLILRLI